MSFQGIGASLKNAPLGDNLLPMFLDAFVTYVPGLYQRSMEGFTGWSMKENIPHVQAPATLLETMLICRIHLDPANTENGVLQVIPSSHRHGIDTPANIMKSVPTKKPVACHVEAGGIVVMRPLLIHRSQKSISLKPRRVIHLEYANQELPHPLQWWQTVGF